MGEGIVTVWAGDGVCEGNFMLWSMLWVHIDEFGVGGLR